MVLFGGLIGLAAAGGIYVLATGNSSVPVSPVSSTQPTVSTTSAAIVPSVPTTSSSATPTQINSSSATVQTPSARACTLASRFNDPGLGFSVGQPRNWGVSYTNSIIFVHADGDLKTTGFAYPVRLLGGSSAASVTPGLVAGLDTILKVDKGSLSLAPDGSLSGSVKGTAIVGQLESAMSGDQTLFFGGWAPADQWPDQQSTIMSIGSCYTSAPGLVLVRQEKIGTDQAVGNITFEIAIPAGWVINNLSARGFDLVADSTATIHYTHTSNMLGDSVADDAMTSTLQSVGETDVKFLAEHVLPSMTDALGTSWDFKAKEYSAMRSGKAIKGVVTVGLANADYGYGYGSSSVIAVLREASADQWESLKGVLGVVQESIQITDPRAGQRLVLPAILPHDTALLLGSSLQNALENQLVAKRDEILGHYEKLKSPSSGERFLVPRNNFVPNGGQGAGYYRTLPTGSLEKLVTDI